MKFLTQDKKFNSLNYNVICKIERKNSKKEIHSLFKFNCKKKVQLEKPN